MRNKTCSMLTLDLSCFGAPIGFTAYNYDYRRTTTVSTSTTARLSSLFCGWREESKAFHIHSCPILKLYITYSGLGFFLFFIKMDPNHNCKNVRSSSDGDGTVRFEILMFVC